MLFHDNVCIFCTANVICRWWPSSSAYCTCTTRVHVVCCRRWSSSSASCTASHWYTSSVSLTICHAVGVEELSLPIDLGVTFDNKLKFDDHIYNAISKAYQMLGIVKRNFIYLTPDSFVILYKSMIRSHLEYSWRKVTKTKIAYCKI